VAALYGNRRPVPRSPRRPTRAVTTPRRPTGFGRRGLAGLGMVKLL